MRKLVALVGGVALGLLCFAADGPAPAKKKSTPKKGVVAAHKKTAGTASSTAAKRGKKGTSTARRTTWRNRQLAPTPERYKEIQRALVSKGYLPADQANGQWGDSSAEALKKFQADQNLDGSGKINSLSLIALGLGPKHDTATVPKPAPSSPGTP
jgi:hypothetical protein